MIAIAIRCVGAMLALLVAGQAFSQSVKLPAEVQGSAGSWVIVAPESVDGGPLKWRLDAGLQEVRLDLLLPAEFLGKLKGKVVTGKSGRYKVEAWNAKANLASDIAVCWVVIGDVPPTPDPGPGPGPGPGPTPVPTPGILGDGFRVLMVIETSQVLPAAQQSGIIANAEVRQWLLTNCTPTADGGKRGFYIVDKDVDMSNESKVWRDGLARPRTGTPWLIISSPSGSFEGPLPSDKASALSLLQKYKGK